MKNTLITPLLGIVATAGCAFGQTVLSEDFSNYVSAGTNDYSSEIGDGNLHEVTSITDWTLQNKVGIFEQKSDKGSLLIASNNTTGQNRATTKITISAAGFYNVTFDSYTVKDSGQSGVGDVFIREAAWLETFEEKSDGASTARSYVVELKKGDYNFGFQNNNGGNQKDVLIDNVKISAVPEPSSTALLGLGTLGLLIRRKR